MSAPFSIPANRVHEIKDPEQIADFVRLVNFAISANPDDLELSIQVLSRHDHDAPEGLEAAPAGVRHLEVTSHHGGTRATFLASLHGLPGSELLGYTVDELGHAAKELRAVITELTLKRALTQEACGKLEELHEMLSYPACSPGRLQPIAAQDVFYLSVLAQPEAAA